MCEIEKEEVLKLCRFLSTLRDIRDFVCVLQHEAVNHGYAAVAEVLLQHGAMVNMPGLDNETPLHDAAANNRLDCVRLLTAYGASSIARWVWETGEMGLCFMRIIF